MVSCVLQLASAHFLFKHSRSVTRWATLMLPGRSTPPCQRPAEPPFRQQQDVAPEVRPVPAEHHLRAPLLSGHSCWRMLPLEECEPLLLPTNCVGGLVATASEWQRCGLEVSWWDLVGFCVFLSFGETAIPHHVPKTNFKMVYVPFSIFLVYLFFLITNFYLPFFVFVCTSKKIVHSLICSRDVSLIFFACPICGSSLQPTACTCSLRFGTGSPKETK